MAQLNSTIEFTKDLAKWSDNVTKWWMDTPETVEIFAHNTERARDIYVYNGFDAVDMFETHGHKIGRNPELYYHLCIMVAMRGTNVDKFRKKMTDEGERKLDEMTRVFELEWNLKGKAIKRTTLTPARMVLLCPELAAHAMRNVNLGVNSGYPYPYRTQAVAALLPDGFVTMKEAAYMAAYHLTVTTAPNMDKTVAFNNTIVYVNAGMLSRLVSNERRIIFWANVKRSNTPAKWKMIKKGILKMAQDFAIVRQQFNSPGPALGNVIEPNVQHDRVPPNELAEELGVQSTSSSSS